MLKSAARLGLCGSSATLQQQRPGPTPFSSSIHQPKMPNRFESGPPIDSKTQTLHPRSPHRQICSRAGTNSPTRRRPFRRRLRGEQPKVTKNESSPARCARSAFFSLSRRRSKRDGAEAPGAPGPRPPQAEKLPDAPWPASIWQAPWPPSGWHRRLRLPRVI